MRNPFKPSAGTRPPEIIGRAGLLDAFDRELNHGSGTPGPTIIAGPRGIGKTVMLREVEDLACSHGWGVISETATTGLVGRLREWVRLQAQDRSDVSAPSGAEGAGLVITVDEIHAVDRRELAKIGSDLEHFVSEGRPVALVVAGLPALVEELLTKESAAFLLSADRIVLRNVAVLAVEESLARTFKQGGFEMPAEIRHQVAEATEGYPFMVQLTGYNLWREAVAAHGLAPAAVARAIERAQERLARANLV